MPAKANYEDERPKDVAPLSAEEIFIRTVIRLTCNDGCEHNEECEQDKIDDYVRTQLPRLLAAERNRWEREHRMCSVCCGNPLPSGRACICGGVGTEIAEAQGLRMEVMRLDKQVVDERNRARRETLAVAIKAQDWFGDHAVMHCELRDNERCHWCTFIAELRALATRTGETERHE